MKMFKKRQKEKSKRKERKVGFEHKSSSFGGSISTYNERESGKKTIYLFHFYYNLSLVIYSSLLLYAVRTYYLDYLRRNSRK